MLALSESMFWLTSLAVAVCSSVAVDICALRWAIPSTAWAMRPSAFPASRALDADLGLLAVCQGHPLEPFQGDQ